MLKRNTGLYISYNNKGQIRKTIVTAKGETHTKTSTISDELIFFEYEPCSFCTGNRVSEWN